MINIIPTLTVMNNRDEYELMINNFIGSNSTIFRCNATRFNNDVYIKSHEILQNIYSKKTNSTFDILLDIPCPKDKIRVKFKDASNSILNDINIFKNDKLGSVR